GHRRVHHAHQRHRQVGQDHRQRNRQRASVQGGGHGGIVLQIRPPARRTKMPPVTVMLAMSVVRAMMLAARRSLPPIILAMTKLEAEVGLAKYRNRTPSSGPVKPSAQAAATASAGRTSIFSMLAPNVVARSLCSSASRDSVPPVQIRASGSVSEAK